MKYILLIVFAATQLFANTITSLEYSWDTPAPPGGGVALTVVPGAQPQVVQSISIAALSNGLHTLYIRALDDSTGWGEVAGEWVYKFASENYQERVVAEFEVWFDDGTRAVYDVPDAATAQLIRSIPVASLSYGLHVLNVRARHQNGEWGQAQSEWVYKFAPPVDDSLLIVQAEVQIDAQTPLYFDVTDDSQTSLTASIAANSIGYGVHAACIRFQDTHGVWSSPDCRNFFVIPGTSNSNEGYIAGAECWINVDPGEGNGIALLPSDGTWDELTETAYVDLTDSIPMGIHLLGIRVRDDAGQWSNVELDTISVGPLLVIQTSGNDVVLSWTDSPEPHSFTVNRSAVSGSGFSPIGSTTEATYTDAGIVNTLPEAYYNVTFELQPGAQNMFRLPDLRKQHSK